MQQKLKLYGRYFHAIAQLHPKLRLTLAQRLTHSLEERKFLGQVFQNQEFSASSTTCAFVLARIVKFCVFNSVGRYR
ncbi:MAG: hypothetical protein HC840_03750 [Leptolyngbyaceae cyanobacterium RM2_2_4]|nr:hypothetical protein [Leptolyngbyaceae cyanobacterium RM2_2_4]